MMDSFDGTTPEDDITATFQCDITQQGSQISIVLYSYPTSWITDNAYYQEYGPGIPPASGGDILFEGTVSGAVLLLMSTHIAHQRRNNCRGHLQLTL